MSHNKYSANEDIILVSTRMFPEKQNMPDPNKEKQLYSNGDIRKKREGGQLFIPTILKDSGKQRDLMDKKRDEEFMLKMENSCQRCGLDITHYRMLHPKEYTYLLCIECNEDLEKRYK